MPNYKSYYQGVKLCNYHKVYYELKNYKSCYQGVRLCNYHTIILQNCLTMYMILSTFEVTINLSNYSTYQTIKYSIYQNIELYDDYLRTVFTKRLVRKIWFSRALARFIFSFHLAQYLSINFHDDLNVCYHRQA